MKKLLITALLSLLSFSSQCGTIVIDPIFYIMSKIMGTSSIQGSGIPKTQHLPIEGIRHISASGMGNLFIKQCENPQDCIEKLTITADDNIVDLLKQKTWLDKLELGIKDNVSFSAKTPIQYHATVKSIDHLFTSGSINIASSSITTKALNITSSGPGDITIQDINAKELKIKKNGNGHIKAHITTDTLEIDPNGNSTIELDGNTNHQEIRLTGNNHYNAKKLESNTVSFSCFGNSEIHLNAKESIKGDMYGNSSGTYNGKHRPKVNVKKYGIARFEEAS